MSGLNHDFMLISRTEHAFSDYSKFINDARAVRLHDDLIRYIADALLWIPTYNPAKNEPHFGLCFYGPTVIHTEGALSAARVFSSWADLFAAGPERLILTGGWTWIEGDPMDQGKYEALKVDRDDFVLKLRQIAAYAQKIIESEGEYYILHYGI